jgi:4,4'-diaponeurosporenoate glycosyltransferase
MTLSLVIVAAGWLSAWLLAARIHRLPRPVPELRSARAEPSVSVVVPARNEQQRLPALLRALRDEPLHEVIVVDDGSTDDTAALALEAGATVVASDPPPGWTGKSWACRRGATEATGDVVAFLDADTEPRAGFVSDLAAEAARTGGLVSVQPQHRIESTYERLSATCALVAVLGAGTGDRPVAFGPAVAVPKSVYEQAGGHEIAAGAVAEDLALAAGFANEGIPVHAYLDGGTGISARMYPEGFRQLAEGWTKNLSAGAGHIPWWRSALVALWITGSLTALTLGPLAYALVALQHVVLLRRVGKFGLATALLWPLPMLAFVVFFTRSALSRLLRRQVSWRGRMVRA